MMNHFGQGLARTSAQRLLRAPHFAGVAAAAIAIAMHASSASAQAAPPEASPPTPPSVGTGEIIVTAQRREESLSKVPLSVSAFNADTLKTRVVTHEQDLAALVPGLVVKSGQNQNQISFTLRGQTLDAFSGASPAVLT